jgi:hypothetical protein
VLLLTIFLILVYALVEMWGAWQRIKPLGC